MTQVNLSHHSPPFMRTSWSSERIMLVFILFLLFPVSSAVYFYGMRALVIIAVSTLTAALSDILMKTIRGRRLTPDGSELITGILLALTLPAEMPLYVPAVGAVFAIVIGKHAFGGLGGNIFNPALAGRAFLYACWPVFINNSYTTPYSFLSDKWQSLNLDASMIVSATPLSKNVVHNLVALNWHSVYNAFIGNIAGAIGETSALMILLAAIPLLMLKIIDWRITASYVLMFLLGSACYGIYLNNSPLLFALYYTFTGGLMLGAVFMATDYVTSPTTKSGRLIFGISLAAVTLILRIFSSMPEGVCYAILLMNAFVPLIDRLTFPKPFGWSKQ